MPYSKTPSRRTYKLVGFRPSRRPHKKYEALLEHKLTGKEASVHFGDDRFEQYHDSTGVGAYAHMDHWDKKRRASYRRRHKPLLRPGYFTPGYFSWTYLW